MKTWFNLAYELIGGKRKSKPFTPVFEELPESEDPSDNLVIDDSGAVMKYHRNVHIDRSQLDQADVNVSMKSNRVYHFKFPAGVVPATVSIADFPSNDQSTTVILVLTSPGSSVQWLCPPFGEVGLEAWRDNEPVASVSANQRIVVSITFVGSHGNYSSNPSDQISISYIES